jgi:phosphatidylglycerophosphatase A
MWLVARIALTGLSRCKETHMPDIGRSWKGWLKWLLATCGGFGYSPILPGTCGALWGVAIYVPLGLWTPEPWQTLGIAVALAASSVATVALARWAEGYFGEEDSGRFVTDEVAGFLLTVLLFRLPNDVWTTVLWAFPVTRIIDIVKLPPTRRLEHLPGGWGVLADDLWGSLYAAGLLHLLAHLAPGWFCAAV